VHEAGVAALSSDRTRAVHHVQKECSCAAPARLLASPLQSRQPIGQRGDNAMITSPERRLAHARVLRARGSVLPPDGQPTDEILDSWARCLEAGLDFAAATPVHVIPAAELSRRRERAAVVRRLAQGELEALAQQIAGSNFLLAFADPDGVILDLCADNRFRMSGSGAGIVPGSHWSEAACGTNGTGTALACGHPISVSGLEHYFLGLGDISCTAAPVRDALGDIVGVLDASSYFESRQHHTRALVQMAATQMENGLFAHQMRHQIVLAVHPRAEFLGTLSTGLLAFGEDGRLLALNARSRQMLQGLQLHPGTSFDELFGEPVEHVLARLHHGGDARLRDVLGSALVARCLLRPAPRTASPPPAPLAQRPDRPAFAVPAQAELVLQDTAVVDAFRLAEAAVRLRAPVLIQGETGTGKEVLARHAHRASGRDGAFVAVNCGALPDELFESELFGHVGGAFTGARREGSVGLIASADGGTLLLDEVRDLPLHLQAALLRFLDDGVVRPVGGTQARRVDVQLLAATNADLLEDIAARRFRADLYYRLATVCVKLPPLRQRRDFGAAVRALLCTLDAGTPIADAAIERLAQHAWPGNFRELRAVLTRAVIAAGGRALAAADVEPLLPPPQRTHASALQQAASDTIRREYERTGRSVSQTSRNLGISRTTVYRHLAAADA
jgi:transcriptional regulator of acetoin/glycerol metabolism